MFGNMIGGALTDYLGRKGMIIMGLIVSALTSLTMGFVQQLEWFYVMGAISGLFATAAGPAHEAMLIDILPEKKRSEGFGVMRVAMNLSIAIGPAIGGFIASYSYLILFIADTVTSLITALIVYLRDVHGIPESGYGWLMTLNAGMVVLFQFMDTRKISRHPPMLIMALGSLLYVIGFGMYGFVSAYLMFMVAMAIITIGEMVIIPVAQAYVGEAAPEDMRGRYSGVMGFSWMIPWMIGPLLAGLIMDNGDPNWVWYRSAILGLIATLGFLWLRKSHDKDWTPAKQATELKTG